MAKTEVISLLIAFFYSILGISLAVITNYFLVPMPDMATLGASALTNPMGAIMSMMSIYFGSIFPVGPGLIILIVLIAIALIIALFANEQIALGLIGATKILMIYLGVTLSFVFMMEAMILKSGSMFSPQDTLPIMGIGIFAASVIGFIIFFALGFVVNKPKRKTIFQEN